MITIIEQRNLSYKEFLDQAKGQGTYWRWGKQGSRISKMQTEFTKTQNIEEAFNLAEKGWPEMAPQIKKGLFEIEKSLGSFVYDIQTQYDVSGSVVDIGRFLDGEPECMMDFPVEEIEKKGKKIRIGIEVGASSKINFDSIFNRGLAIVSFINSLEDAGYRVELTAIKASRDDSKTKGLIYNIVVKEFDQILDIDKIVFIFCHPSFNRRIAFSFYENLSKEILSNVNLDGYGFSDLAKSYDFKNKYDLFVPAFFSDNTDFISHNSTVDWLKKEIKRIIEKE